jgi:hypothetical protein
MSHAEETEALLDELASVEFVASLARLGGVR